MSKYLIAGAGGFIGGYITRNLINEGHEVVCADLKLIHTGNQNIIDIV